MTNKTTSAIDLVTFLRGFSPNAPREGERERIVEAADTITRLQAALEPFARIADKGKHGGRFLIASASYLLANGKLDATPRESHWHWDDFERARDAYRSSVRGE